MHRRRHRSLHACSVRAMRTTDSSSPVLLHLAAPQSRVNIFTHTHTVLPPTGRVPSPATVTRLHFLLLLISPSSLPLPSPLNSPSPPLQGLARFSLSDRCHLSQRFLPTDGPSVIDRVRSRAYIGRFSADGGNFIAGFQVPTCGARAHLKCCAVQFSVLGMGRQIC